MNSLNKQLKEALQKVQMLLNEQDIKFEEAFELKDGKIVKVLDAEKAKAFKDKLTKDGNTWKYKSDENEYEIDKSCEKEIEEIASGGSEGSDGAPAPIAEVFKIEEKDKKKTIVEILDEGKAKNKAYVDGVTKSKDGKVYFLEYEKENYTFDEKLTDKCKELYPNAKEKVEKNDDAGKYDLDKAFELLGESITYLAISGITGGKMNKGVDVDSKELSKGIEGDVVLDRYKIVFKNIDEKDDFYTSKTVYDIMDDFAARAAYFEANKAGKTDSSKEYVKKGEDDKIESFDVDLIKSDSATKAFFEKTLAGYQDSFDAGAKKAKEQCEKNKDGGKIKDPITNKVLEVPSSSIIGKALKDTAGKIGGTIRDVLGLNGNDIYSKMFGMIVGQFKDGSTCRKLLAKASAARYKDAKKLKLKVVKGHVLEVIKAVEAAKKDKAIPQ